MAAAVGALASRDRQADVDGYDSLWSEIMAEPDYSRIPKRKRALLRATTALAYQTAHRAYRPATALQQPTVEEGFKESFTRSCAVTAVMQFSKEDWIFR